jgi:chromosome segregation ATPase
MQEASANAFADGRADKQLSWLQTTVGDANEPILRAQIDVLQDELDNANGQLDSNFSRLEVAGMNGIRLAEDLAEARQRIHDLEEEIREMMLKNKASFDTLYEERDQRA